MDHLSNISGSDLAALANSIALFINKNYSVADIAKFVAFFTSIADILSLLVIDKVVDDSDSSTSSNIFDKNNSNKQCT